MSRAYVTAENFRGRLERKEKERLGYVIKKEENSSFVLIVSHARMKKSKFSHAHGSIDSFNAAHTNMAEHLNIFLTLFLRV